MLCCSLRFCTICSVDLCAGINILTFMFSSLIELNSMAPIFSWRMKALVVGNISIISFSAVFTRFKYIFRALSEFGITSMLARSAPSSISLILSSAGIALFQKESKTYCWCSTSSLILLKIIIGAGCPFSCEVVGARYSLSLIIKLPFIPSRWRSSSTIFIISLQEDRLSFVISVRYLNFTALLLTSTNDFLIDSISIANGGRV